ncbi:hypothetical protein IGI04_026660, partial [Brassica rapa subsp. trilocularis]
MTPLMTTWIAGDLWLMAVTGGDELSDTNLEQNELSYIEVVMDRARKEESRPKPDDRSELSFSVKKETKIHSP